MEIKSYRKGASQFAPLSNLHKIVDSTLSSDAKKAITQNLNFTVSINTIKKVLKGEGKDFTEGSPGYFYTKGIMAKNVKKYDKAIEYFKKAIGLDNGYVDAYISI